MTTSKETAFFANGSNRTASGSSGKSNYFFKIHKTIYMPDQTRLILINKDGNKLINNVERNIRNKLGRVDINTRSIVNHRFIKNEMEMKKLLDEYRLLFDHKQIFQVIYQDFQEFLFILLNLTEKKGKYNLVFNNSDEKDYICSWLTNNLENIKENKKRYIKERLIRSGLYGKNHDKSPFTNFAFFIPSEDGDHYEILYQIETYVHGLGTLQRIR